MEMSSWARISNWALGGFVLSRFLLGYWAGRKGLLQRHAVRADTVPSCVDSQLQGYVMRHCTLLLLLVSCLLTANVAAEPSRRSAYLESEKSLSSVEVTTYARQTGLSPEEARLALAREELAAPQISALRAEFSARMAGLFWVRLPSQRVVVRLTGSGDVVPRKIKTEAGIVTVDFVTGAAATADELGAALSAAGPSLRKAVPDLHGAWVDETTGKIVLDVASTAASKRAYDRERTAIEKLMGFPVEFRFLPAPQDLSTPAVPEKPANRPATSKRALPNAGFQLTRFSS